MMGHHIKQLPLWAGLSGSLSDLHSVPDDDNEGKDKEGYDNEDTNNIENDKNSNNDEMIQQYLVFFTK